VPSKRLCLWCQPSPILFFHHQLVLGRQPNQAPLHQTHQFLCFQIVQAPKTIRELSPFLTNPRVSSSILCHHSRKEGSVRCGVRSWRVTFCRKLNQNCLAKTHELIRWSMVSSSLSQKGHFPFCLLMEA
jgi:hypothetical protein